MSLLVSGGRPLTESEETALSYQVQAREMANGHAQYSYGYPYRILPYHVVQEDGSTLYYGGRSTSPLFIVQPDGSGFWGLFADRTPENELLISLAAKRAYAPARKGARA